MAGMFSLWYKTKTWASKVHKEEMDVGTRKERDGDRERRIKIGKMTNVKGNEVRKKLQMK